MKSYFVLNLFLLSRTRFREKIICLNLSILKNIFLFFNSKLDCSFTENDHPSHHLHQNKILKDNLSGSRLNSSKKFLLNSDSISSSLNNQLNTINNLINKNSKGKMNGIHSKNYSLNDQLKTSAANLLTNNMDFLMQNGLLNGTSQGNLSNIKLGDNLNLGAAMTALLASSDTNKAMMNGLVDGNLNLFNQTGFKTAFHNHLQNYTNPFSNTDSNSAVETNSNQNSNLLDLTPAMILQNNLTSGSTTGFDAINSLLKPINGILGMFKVFYVFYNLLTIITMIS